ncbi:PREDICTED: uncharacterized protein LOC106785053 [Polistes canadensis]|uniref:uncharacterized protein LOC106785053 n=1 Tax=Polistes canadensis TaxID=91411 RepID=UPI000718B000|nr:PREDICTED: uncharacterized protein LOC106785053 [Polistes canadensis]
MPSPLTLQLIIEYTKWRSWDQIVLFDNLSPKNCVMRYARPLMACLAESGISVSIQSATNPNIPVALTIRRHRIGSIVLLDGFNFTSPNNVLQMASQKLLFNYYVSWFMITARNTDTTIDGVLKDLNIGIDSDVVVATSLHSQDVMRELTLKYRNRTCSSLRRYGQPVNFQNLTERQNPDRMMNLDYITRENRTMCYHFLHVYKIRNNDNSSLVVYSLGSWCPGIVLLKNPMSVKLRKDFKGWPIIFGVLNGTNDGQTDITNEFEVNDIAPLLDFANSNVNDSNLRQLYIKAFNSRESRLGATTGLMKASQERYGFFVSATLARRALRTTFIQERCTLKELPLPQTFTLVALPMANTCPYKKIINLSILRIQEHGVLRRIAERMLPEMPTCKAPTTFNSARLADVYSAFLILIVGLITAVSIGIFERIWNKRKQMQESIVRGFRHHHNDHSYQPYTINDHSNKPVIAASYLIDYSNLAQKNSDNVTTIRKKSNETSSTIVKGRSSATRSSSVRKRSANGMSKKVSWVSFIGISQKKSIIPIDKLKVSTDNTIKTKNTEETDETKLDVLPFRL